MHTEARAAPRHDTSRGLLSPEHPIPTTSTSITPNRSSPQHPGHSSAENPHRPSNALRKNKTPSAGLTRSCLGWPWPSTWLSSPAHRAPPTSTLNWSPAEQLQPSRQRPSCSASAQSALLLTLHAPSVSQITSAHQDLVQTSSPPQNPAPHTCAHLPESDFRSLLGIPEQPARSPFQNTPLTVL